MNPQPTPPEKQANGFEKQLEQGQYLGILESYRVQWNMEKASRDILQNFFDADGGTLDNTHLKIIEEGMDEKQQTVKIAGNGEYDFRKLLHIGGTSKAGHKLTAGGFGEGSKILALVLLRDHDFSAVKFGSGDWTIEYYLHDAPEGSYDIPAKGLYAKLTKGNKQPGNFIELKTASKENAIAIEQAKALFYSSENPDFQDPTMAVEHPPGGFGFKFLGVDEWGRVNKGHLYDAGQRRHYNKDSKGWDTVGGVNLWTKHKVFGGDRDRGAVESQKVEKEVIQPMVEATDPEQLKEMLLKMELAWPTKATYAFDAAYKIMETAAKKLAKNGEKMRWDDKYLASDPYMPFAITNMLKEKNVLCHPFFKQIGMKSATERFVEMQEHIRSEPTPEEARRITLLQQVGDLLQESFERKHVKKSIQNKEIWLYSRANEKSIIEGQYNEKFVWLSQEVMKQPFSRALAVYLHELDHQYGSDQSAEFSYAVTDSLEVAITALLEDEESYQKFMSLKKKWDSAKTEKE